MFEIFIVFPIFNENEIEGNRVKNVLYMMQRRGGQ